MHFFARMHVPRCHVNTTLSNTIFSREYQLFACWLKCFFEFVLKSSCCQSVYFLRYVASKLSFHSILHSALPMLNGASNPASRQPRPLLIMIVLAPLLWWTSECGLFSHNGKTMFLSPVRESSISLNFYADACKKACSNTFLSCWFVIKFPVSWQERNIGFLEFYPIVIALQIFGVQLSNWNIVFHCDNKAIVDVINKQSCKDVELIKLMLYMVLTAM